MNAQIRTEKIVFFVRNTSDLRSSLKADDVDAAAALHIDDRIRCVVAVSLFNLFTFLAL